MVVYLNRNSSQDQPKFGVVVSKLVGNAVQRNLVKRRAKAALHNRMDKFKLGDSLVVRALPGLAEIKFDQMNQELDQAITLLQGKGDA